MAVGDGGDDGLDRSADRAFRGLPAPHRRLDRRLGPQVIRRPSPPRFSTLVAGALGIVAVLLAATAVLLNYSGEPHGKVVVTVRIWADQIGSAYHESFEAFTRA